MATKIARQQGYSAAMRKQQIAKRRGMYTVPRTRGALGVTERKYFDTFLNAAALTSPNTWAGTEVDPATLNCLFCPQEGSDIDNRVGRKVNVVKMIVRGVIVILKQANQTASDDGALCRVILYMDQQTNGTQAQGENLMQDPGAANASLCMSIFQNTANFGRFRVLKDKVLTLSNPNIAWDGTNMEQQGTNRAFKFSLKFRRPVTVRFNGTNGGSVADIIDNSFHMIAACNSGDLTPTLYYQVRTVYYDA